MASRAKLAKINRICGIGCGVAFIQNVHDDGKICVCWWSPSIATPQVHHQIEPHEVAMKNASIGDKEATLAVWHICQIIQLIYSKFYSVWSFLRLSSLSASVGHMFTFAKMQLITTSGPLSLLSLLITWAIFSSVVVSGQRTINSAHVQLISEFVNKTDKYWYNVTSAFEKHIRSKSLTAFREWNYAVGKGNLKSKVSRQCLDVIEHIIRHPLDQEWSARSKRQSDRSCKR